MTMAVMILHECFIEFIKQVGEKLFLKEFNKFSNTGARMLDSIYHLILKLINTTFLV